MQGLVTLDFGNTNPHAGIFQKNLGSWNLVKTVPFAELSIYLNQLQINSANSSVVLSEVKSREEELAPLAEQGYLITRIKDYWRGVKFAGMPVNYAQTLGEDRLICAHFAYKKERKPVLIIDAGTYTTMDVVTPQGFMGGYIIPSAENYFTTYKNGEQLKNIDLSFTANQSLPQITIEAMAASYSAFAALAKKLVSEHSIEKIILTGGSSGVWQSFFKDQQEGRIVEEHPHLVHWALQHWFTTQIELL